MSYEVHTTWVPPDFDLAHAVREEGYILVDSVSCDGNPLDFNDNEMDAIAKVLNDNRKRKQDY